jgi:hypothetical protein
MREPITELTDEQVKNWRVTLSGLLGAYAVIMPVDQIIKFANQFQEEADQCAKDLEGKA